MTKIDYVLLEHQSDSSNKFYEAIRLYESHSFPIVNFRWGRIGKPGQMKGGQGWSTFMNKIDEKRNKGYEVARWDKGVTIGGGEEDNLRTALNRGSSPEVKDAIEWILQRIDDEPPPPLAEDGNQLLIESTLEKVQTNIMAIAEEGKIDFVAMQEIREEVSRLRTLMDSTEEQFALLETMMVSRLERTSA